MFDDAVTSHYRYCSMGVCVHSIILHIGRDLGCRVLLALFYCYLKNQSLLMYHFRNANNS